MLLLAELCQWAAAPTKAEGSKNQEENGIPNDGLDNHQRLIKLMIEAMLGRSTSDVVGYWLQLVLAMGIATLGLAMNSTAPLKQLAQPSAKSCSGLAPSPEPPRPFECSV